MLSHRTWDKHSNSIGFPQSEYRVLQQNHLLLLGLQYDIHTFVQYPPVLRNTVYNVQCTVHNVHYTVYIIQCTLYSVLYTVYSVHYTVYIIQCTVCTCPCCSILSASLLTPPHSARRQGSQLLNITDRK